MGTLWSSLFGCVSLGACFGNKEGFGLVLNEGCARCATPNPWKAGRLDVAIGVVTAIYHHCTSWLGCTIQIYIIIVKFIHTTERSTLAYASLSVSVFFRHVLYLKLSQAGFSAMQSLFPRFYR